jgi:hypothetical protein
MGDQTRQNVTAVLPDRLDDNEGRVLWYMAKDFDAMPLAVYEAMSLLRVDRMPTAHRPPFVSYGGGHSLLYRPLCGPTLTIRRKAHVAAGD